MSEPNKPTDRMYWHGIFYEVAELELSDYKDQLRIENEHLLSKQALQIDVLVIKKDKDLTIEKNIGRAFKEYNILEYKSLADKLEPNDYLKGIAYGLIYASFNDIEVDDITITFIIPKLNNKLRSYLIEHRGYEIIEIETGIHQIKGDSFTTQIIEQEKLSSDSNLFLSNIKKNIPKQDVEKMILSLDQQGTLNNKSRVVQMLVQTSFDSFKEVMDMNADLTLDEAMEKLKDTGTWYQRLVTKDVQQAKLDIARKMLHINEPHEKIALLTDLPLETIANL